MDWLVKSLSVCLTPKNAPMPISMRAANMVMENRTPERAAQGIHQARAASGRFRQKPTPRTV